MSIALPIQADNRIRRYTASQGQKVFSIPFPFQQNEDISVQIYSDGVYSEIDPHTLVIIGSGRPEGGSVTLSSGRNQGDIVVVVGRAVLDRLSSIVRDGRFASKLTDDEFDRNRIIQQEQQRDIDRSLKFDFGLSFAFIQQPVDGRSLVWKKHGLFWTIENGPDAWQEVSRLDREIVDREAADAEEKKARIAGDNALHQQIDGIIPTVTQLTNRAEAAAESSENFAQTAQDLVEAATSGSIGFQPGIAYDFGWTSDQTTYFDRDFGSIV